MDNYKKSYKLVFYLNKRNSLFPISCNIIQYFKFLSRTKTTINKSIKLKVMKKIILIATFALLATLNSQAQLFSIGAKAGLNYANLTGSQITVNSQNYNAEAITSYHVGLIAELKVGDKFGIQPELLYSTQGATYRNAISEFNNELGYLSIPVMAKIYLNNSFSLELGPQASFLLSDKNNVSFGDSNTFDFAIAGGLGIKITKSIFVQARYGVGLTEVSANAKAKNSVLQFSAGFLF